MALPGQVLPPQIALSDAAPTLVVGADVVAVPVLVDGDSIALGPGAAELLDELDLDVFSLLERHGAAGKAGEVVEHPVLSSVDMANANLKCVMFVGIGEGAAADLRCAGASLARRTKGRECLATSLAALPDDVGLRARVEGLVLGSFGFHRRSAGPKEAPVASVVLAGVSDSDSRQDALARGVAVAGAGWTSRAMSLVPSNEKNPLWMADQAAQIATSSGLEIRIWDEKELTRDGFGGLVGVGRASATPPRLIRLDYTPAKTTRQTRHVVLVGKGITFDTGGLSIKPAESMMNMKRDMTGGGVVLAVMGALAALSCPVKVTGLVPCAEPHALVDIATLTGAMKVALGQRTGGMFVNDDALAGLLLVAGTAAGEPLWRMPLVEDYEERLESKVADADNAADGPGAITAALFLRHFAGSLPWAHLDIASVGDSPSDSAEWTEGATGFGARALLHWLELSDPLEGVAFA